MAVLFSKMSGIFFMASFSWHLFFKPRPAVKALGSALCCVFNYQSLEVRTRKKREQLAEHAAKIPLTGGLPRLVMCFHSPSFSAKSDHPFNAHFLILVLDKRD